MGLFTTLDYDKAIYGLASGAVSKQYIASQYTKMRNKMLAQIKEVQLSAYKFRRSEDLPKVPTWKEIRKSGFEDISHAVADINRILKEETLVGRKTRIDKAVAGMQKIFPSVSVKNYDQYADFFDWFRENQVNKLFDSAGTIIKEFIADRANMALPSSQRSWARIFVKWLLDNGHDDEAQSVGEMFFASYRRKG